MLLCCFATTNGQAIEPSIPDAETQASLDHAERLSKAFAWSANRIRPSVVEISTGRRVQTGHPFFNRQTMVTGTGSGVIVDSRGFILTNYHVVENVQALVVSLHDGREFKARLVGADAMADLAVLLDAVTDHRLGRQLGQALVGEVEVVEALLRVRGLLPGHAEQGLHLLHAAEARAAVARNEEPRDAPGPRELGGLLEHLEKHGEQVRQFKDSLRHFLIRY